jgi:hypothetical protein
MRWPEEIIEKNPRQLAGSELTEQPYRGGCIGRRNTLPSAKQKNRASFTTIQRMVEKAPSSN